MPWLVLFVAGLFEIAWAIGLEYSDGFTEPIPTAGARRFFISVIAFGIVGLRLVSGGH